MRNSMLTFAFFCFTISAFAQGTIDLKTAPLRPVFFKNAELLAEYAINKNVGVELGVRTTFGNQNIDITANNENTGEIDFKRQGAVLYAAGHYYFKPEYGADNFSIGAYMRSRSTSFSADADEQSNENFKWNRVALGLVGGYKWVGENNLVFELDLGIGRAISNKFSYEDEENRTIQEDNLNLTALPGLNIDMPGRILIGYRFGGQG